MEWTMSSLQYIVGGTQQNGNINQGSPTNYVISTYNMAPSSKHRMANWPVAHDSTP